MESHKALPYSATCVIWARDLIHGEDCEWVVVCDSNERKIIADHIIVPSFYHKCA